jgi:hypothetical protein
MNDPDRTRRPVQLLQSSGVALANLAFAALGPAIAEGLLESLVGRQNLYAPRSYAMLTAAVAFVFGCAVYGKWKSGASQWVGLLGLIGFACRVFFGPAGPALPAAGEWYLLEFVSLRLIAYSSGALLCARLSRARAIAAA